ncbi:hypothetical protein Ade02nite_36080 [Paractinoplanes deccanensis]|uniref:Uncharacterized protein n=1 Tax=Paractinoplanes deccanensis TaxID=113561 RepID=A0ABQ3Y4P0_9ACTN|nr:hypothetical protein [Actinoplanes deccanensis]GID74967.1 hypothetical protein Ade02nite_36080 [Actinoplanes deccanensis]
MTHYAPVRRTPPGACPPFGHTPRADWSRALDDLHRALLPGATPAFESRNPSARAWERWARTDTLRTVDGSLGFAGPSALR